MKFKKEFFCAIVTLDSSSFTLNGFSFRIEALDHNQDSFIHAVFVK